MIKDVKIIPVKHVLWSRMLTVFQEAAQALLSAALAGSQLPNIINKANEYILRAEELKKASK